MMLCAFRCGEEPVYVCGDTILHFEINIAVSPLSGQYHIGDTLWVTVAIPGSLKDLNSNEYIPVLDYDFKIGSLINRMDISNTPPAFHEFGYVQQTGKYTINNPSSFGALARVTTEPVNGEQKFQVGFIPLSKGLFQLSFSNWTHDLRCQPLPAFGKALNTLDLSYRMNNGDLEENNYPMLLASPIAATQPELISTPEAILKDGVYIFQVIE